MNNKIVIIMNALHQIVLALLLEVLGKTALPFSLDFKHGRTIDFGQ